MLQKKQSGHKLSMSITDYKYKQLLSSCQHEHPSAHHGIGELTQYKREREREKNFRMEKYDLCFSLFISV